MLSQDATPAARTGRCSARKRSWTPIIFIIGGMTAMSPKAKAESPEAATTSTNTRPQTTNLFLIEDLDDLSRTTKLAKSDLDALRAVADWIKSFVARPHKDLGREGPVCPFVPEALERKTLWLASENS